jgi:hypothetical protein
MRPARHRRPSLIPGAHQVSRKGDEGIMGEARRVGISGMGDFVGNEWEQGVGWKSVRVWSTLGQLGAAPHPYPLPLSRGRGGAGVYAAPLIRPHLRSARFGHLLPQGAKVGRRQRSGQSQKVMIGAKSMQAPPSPLVGEGGRAQRGRMRGALGPVSLVQSISQSGGSEGRRFLLLFRTCSPSWAGRWTRGRKISIPG